MTPMQLWAAHGRPLAGLYPTLLYVAPAVSLGSVYVVWLNDPETRQVIGALVVLACSVTALALRRFPTVVVLLCATGGGAAVALTSRDYFAYWPAASVLLVSSAVAEFKRREVTFPSVAAAGAVAGLAGAALGPDAQVWAPTLPISVAAGALICMRLAAPWVARTRDLKRRAEEYQHRAEVTEAANFELERRTALARELHDSLGHHVTAIVVQAEAGRVIHADRALAKIAELGRTAMEELEAVLFDLRAPSAAPVGTVEVDLGRIDSRLAEPLRHQGVRVQVAVSTSETEHARLVATYRIVQEALTNTMRHAAASEVSVVIGDEGKDLVVEVRDDGVGLPAETHAGNGLAGIYERAAVFGGEAQILAIEPRGTLVRVRIPRTYQ